VSVITKPYHRSSTGVDLGIRTDLDSIP